MNDNQGLAQKIIASYTELGRRIVTAESCTGGLIAAALTDIPGSSAVLERGFVAYSNDAKVEALGVLPDLIDMHGAVSPRVAEEMAIGALEFSRAHISISTTGIAGPGGGSAGKPVGLVFFGIATRDGALMHYRCEFAGNRDQIRGQAVAEALRLLESLGES